MKTFQILGTAVLLLLSSAVFAGPQEDLVEAIKIKDTQKVEAAITAGADVNGTFDHYLIWQFNRTRFKKFTPLMLASEMGYTDGVLRLLHAGAKVNTTANCGTGVYRETCITTSGKGITALHLAAGNGHSEVVELLIRGKGKLTNLMVTKTSNKLNNLCVAHFANGQMAVGPKGWAKKCGQDSIIELIKTSKKEKWVKKGLPPVL